MNLRIKTEGLELEIQNGDVTRIEKALLATFAYLENKSFVETYNSIEAEERPVNSKRNFVPTVNGIKIFNGEENYQCSYKCTCGHSGKRFVKKDATDTTCHQCGQLLSVVPAADGGLPDHECNYFVAY